MMENHYRKDGEKLRELLKRYENLKNGRHHSFLEEESFEKIIEYFQEKEELPKAMEAAASGCRQYPYSASLLLKKADIMVASRRYQEALNILEKATVLDGGDMNLYLLKTEACLALGQQEKAAALAGEALSLFEGEEKLELLFELADIYDDYEDFDKVFDCLKMILKDDPNNEEALYKICFWTDFNGRNEESIRLHQKIIDAFPYNKLAWFNLAAAFQGIKLYEKAIDAYRYAVAIDEEFDYAYRNMGDAYIRLRKYREAVEVLEKVNELAQPEEVILEALGHCYEKLKNFALARNHYRKASQLRREDSHLYYKIACTYYKEQQWTNCLKQLDIAIRIHHLQPEYHLLAGECRMHLGLFKEAIRHFSTVVRNRPRNKAGWEALVRCLFRAEYFDEALEQVVAARHNTGFNTLFVYYKAAILFALGNTKEAVLQLELAMESSPRMLKKFIALQPSILNNQLVVDVIARSKRRNSA